MRCRIRVAIVKFTEGIVLISLLVSCGTFRNPEMEENVPLVLLVPEESADRERMSDFHSMTKATRGLYYGMAFGDVIKTLGEPEDRSSLDPISKKSYSRDRYYVRYEFGEYQVYMSMASKDDTLVDIIYVDQPRHLISRGIPTKAGVFISSVENGMTEQEVRELCGDPERIGPDPTNNDPSRYVLYYQMYPQQNVMIAVILLKENNRVIEYYYTR